MSFSSYSELESDFHYESIYKMSKTHHLEEKALLHEASQPGSTRSKTAALTQTLPH